MICSIAWPFAAPQWNERDAPESYNAALRAAVAGSELAGTTTVLNRLPHYPGTGSSNDPDGCKSQDWNSTDGRYWVDEEGSIFDGRSARCLARCINRGYVTGCMSPSPPLLGLPPAQRPPCLPA